MKRWGSVAGFLLVVLLSSLVLVPTFGSASILGVAWWNVSCNPGVFGGEDIWVDSNNFYAKCDTGTNTTIYDKITFPARIGITPSYPLGGAAWSYSWRGFATDDSYIYASYSVGSPCSLLNKYDKFTGDFVLNSTGRCYCEFGYDGSSKLYAIYSSSCHTNDRDRIDELDTNFNILKSYYWNTSYGIPGFVLADSTYFYPILTDGSKWYIEKVNKVTNQSVYIANDIVGYDPAYYFYLSAAPIQDNDNIYLYSPNTSLMLLRKYSKSDGSLSGLFTDVSSGGESQLATDQNYVYISANGVGVDECRIYWRRTSISPGDTIVIYKNNMTFEETLPAANNFYIYNKTQCDEPLNPPAPPTTCQVCSVGNIPPSMGPGAIVWVLICGILNLMTCVPIILVGTLVVVVVVIAVVRRRRRR